MKIKIKDLSTRFKVLLLTGSIALVGGAGYAIGNHSKNSSESKASTTELEMTTEATVENTVASDNQIYYDEVNALETDIVEFCDLVYKDFDLFLNNCVNV